MKDMLEALERLDHNSRLNGQEYFDLLQKDIAIIRAGLTQLREDNNKRAPVQGYYGKTIPWRVHGLAWEAYAKRYGRQQDAELLARRGGFGVCEMDQYLPGWRDMV